MLAIIKIDNRDVMAVVPFSYRHSALIINQFTIQLAAIIVNTQLTNTLRLTFKH